jgi:hypothetical protein
VPIADIFDPPIMVLLGSEKTGSQSLRTGCGGGAGFGSGGGAGDGPGGFGMLSWKPSSRSRVMIARRSLSSDGIILPALSSNPFRHVGLSAVGSLSLCRAAFEVGAFLDGEGLVVNIADDMRF